MATTAKTIPYPVAGDNNDTPQKILDLANWLEGLLTEMTTTARDAMAAGLKWRGRRIYNTTTAQMEWYNGTAWEADGWLRGEIKWLAYKPGTVPTGFLLCDGSTVSRTTYADLFAKLSTTHNTGGEAGTDFRLPNLKQRVVVGYDAGDLTNYDVGKTGGALTFTISATNIPPHQHDMTHDHPAGTTSTDGNHQHTFDGSGLSLYVPLLRAPGGIGYVVGQVTHAPGSGNYVLFSTSTTDISYFPYAQVTGAHSHTFDVGNYAASTGVGPGASTAIDNRQPFVTLYPVIKT